VTAPQMARSAKKEFELVLERFIDKKSAQMVQHGAEADRPSPFNVLRHLQVDQRAQIVWTWLDGDETKTTAFLEGVADALTEFWLIGTVKEVDERRDNERQDALHAIGVLLDFCQHWRRMEVDDEPGVRRPRLPPSLEEQLRLTLSFLWENWCVDRDLFDPVLPKSRKHRSDLHLACLMVRQMQTRFGRPLYERVAETINVLFGFNEGDGKELSANGVRKAWSRQKAADSGRAGGTE
jgi:hypothetical protein